MHSFFDLYPKECRKNEPIVTDRFVRQPIGQALAPYHLAGRCAVNELDLSRTLNR